MTTTEDKTPAGNSLRKAAFQDQKQVFSKNISGSKLA